MRVAYTTIQTLIPDFRPRAQTWEWVNSTAGSLHVQRRTRKQSNPSESCVVKTTSLWRNSWDLGSRRYGNALSFGVGSQISQENLNFVPKKRSISWTPFSNLTPYFMPLSTGTKMHLEHNLLESLRIKIPISDLKIGKRTVCLKMRQGGKSSWSWTLNA